MTPQRSCFDVRRGGIPIQEMPLRHGVNPNISYSLSFLGFEAASAAGLDLWQWENGGYDTKFMARVIAWYKLHNLVEAHAKDAASK